jgi:hypothetical protein
VVEGGAAVGGGFGGWVGGGWVGGGLAIVVVGRGRVEGGLVVDGDVCGGAVVWGGPMTWAPACHMAAATKAVVLSTTIPAARQRALTP